MSGGQEITAAAAAETRRLTLIKSDRQNKVRATTPATFSTTSTNNVKNIHLHLRQDTVGQTGRPFDRDLGRATPRMSRSAPLA